MFPTVRNIFLKIKQDITQPTKKSANSLIAVFLTILCSKGHYFFLGFYNSLTNSKDGHP